VGEFNITEYTKFKLRRFEFSVMLSCVVCEMVPKSNSGLVRPDFKALMLFRNVGSF
jgi:hypothetical protein